MAATPSSLRWLIRQYSRAKGERQKQVRLLISPKRDLSRLIKIRQLDRQLSHLKAVMALHEVQIDPEDLRPVKPQDHRAILGHGRLTRLIYELLRGAADHTATTPQIVAAVMEALPAQPDRAETERIKDRVRVRLCIMAQRGSLARLPRAGPCNPCVWCFPGTNLQESHVEPDG